MPLFKVTSSTRSVTFTDETEAVIFWHSLELDDDAHLNCLQDQTGVILDTGNMIEFKWYSGTPFMINRDLRSQAYLYRRRRELGYLPHPHVTPLTVLPCAFTATSERPSPQRFPADFSAYQPKPVFMKVQNPYFEDHKYAVPDSNPKMDPASEDSNLDWRQMQAELMTQSSVSDSRATPQESSSSSSSSSSLSESEMGSCNKSYWEDNSHCASREPAKEDTVEKNSSQSDDESSSFALNSSTAKEPVEVASATSSVKVSGKAEDTDICSFKVTQGVAMQPTLNQIKVPSAHKIIAAQFSGRNRVGRRFVGNRQMGLVKPLGGNTRYNSTVVNNNSTSTDSDVDPNAIVDLQKQLARLSTYIAIKDDELEEKSEKLQEKWKKEMAYLENERSLIRLQEDRLAQNKSVFDHDKHVYRKFKFQIHSQQIKRERLPPQFRNKYLAYERLDESMKLDLPGDWEEFCKVADEIRVKEFIEHRKLYVDMSVKIYANEMREADIPGEFFRVYYVMKQMDDNDMLEPMKKDSEGKDVPNDNLAYENFISLLEEYMYATNDIKYGLSGDITYLDKIVMDSKIRGLIASIAKDKKDGIAPTNKVSDSNTVNSSSEEEDMGAQSSDSDEEIPQLIPDVESSTLPECVASNIVNKSSYNDEEENPPAFVDSSDEENKDSAK
jgi:hypothetical protein